ncbi:hypothetical protein [Caulobacter sp.]|uniref:hypothetical protein n=1 Tax=Caulobacter sp. TaxID=78 RepID=UPI001B0C318C|nr:hypothetical protein [Caulobacter sp.]MBO9543356.1 hypothetical protein [Caulobacter sp.]
MFPLGGCVRIMPLRSIRSEVRIVTQETGLGREARVRAYAFAVVCTGLGWTGAIIGHQTDIVAVKAALILAVVACGVAVLFTGFMVREMAPREDRRLLAFHWKVIPWWLAITPMGSLFVFGVSALSVGLAVGVSLLMALPRLTVWEFVELAEGRSAHAADPPRYGPTVLGGEGEKPKGRD